MKKKRMTDYKDQILKLAESGKHISAIAKELGLEKGSVSYFCKINNIELVNGKFKFTREEESKLVQSYKEGKSAYQISRETGMVSGAVYELLERHKCERRDNYESKASRGFTINHDCFSDFSREADSYWYGFLLADGCISNGIVSLALKPSDRYFVEAFKEYSGGSGKIRDVTSFNKSVQKEYKFCSFSIKDLKLEERLAAQGFEPRKSCRERPPHFLTYTITDRHFWRGVIDGDGYIRKDVNNPEINIIGSQGLLESFRKFCESVTDVKRNKLIRQRPNSDLHLMSYCGSEAIKVMSVLWSEYSLCLKRKEEIVKSVIEHRKGKLKHGPK